MEIATNVVTQKLIQHTDWSGVGTAAGDGSAVPGALDALISARCEESARAAYWSHLDNEVVVQGQLFPAAQAVVGPLLVELAIGELSQAARHRVVELLVEIALGEPELVQGPSDPELAKGCQRELRAGLWIFYGLLSCNDERVVIGSLDILESIETDRLRLVAVCRGMINSFDAAAQRRAVEIMMSVPE